MYILAFVVALFLLLGGIDDVLLDFHYWFNAIFRPRQLNEHRYEIPEDLDRVPQKPIALFVPAWQEHEVIDTMLIRACETIDYENYDIFVGVYQNDPETRKKVERVASQFPKVHAVIGSHDGPSTKAENLNEMHGGMLRHENISGKRYDIIVMHDSEDVIHSLSLKLHNYFVPKYDMVQLPVYPLVVPYRKLVHWTYADEFAEHHSKDLVARQLLSDFVPSAGVGTGYNRWLIEFAGTSFARNIFRKASLTEDYDIALRLALGKARLAYLFLPMNLPVATCAYFPMTFAAAVRQKTRWLIGICLQSWDNIGWVGNSWFRFTLYHDRKAVVTNIVNVLAYLVLIYILFYELARWGLTHYGTLKPVIQKGTPLYGVVLIDTGFMLWRFLNRFIMVRRVYGIMPGMLSIIRLPVANLINFLAAVRGISQYISSRLNKTRVRWEKTTHRHFPGMKQK
jgi:adsorption protein B